MSKAIAATCTAGVVKVGDLPIADATILSAGVGASSGILLLDEDEQTYIPDTTPDLETTLDQASSALADIGDALTEVATALTAIAAVPSGWVTPPASVAANVATITAKIATIAAAQAALDTLKGNLK